MYSNLGRNTTTQEAWPFADLGTHYVYAKEGEFIAVASSAMGYGNGGIRITRPDGSSFDYTGTEGRILARANEIAGPRLPGGGGNTYIPHEIEVQSGQEGVWKIEFLPVGPENTTTQPYNPGSQAADTWTQNTSNVANNSLIAAWDVSVRSDESGPWQWIPGRVYVNVLNLYIPQVDGSDLPKDRSFGGVYGGVLENEVLNTSIGGGQTSTHSNLTCAGTNQQWVVNISGSGYSDEISWELHDADDNVVLSGGPYVAANEPYDFTDSVFSSNGPFEFFIESEGQFNDNDPSYTVTCISEDEDCGFDTCGAVVYVLTKDGYIYQVNNNGNYGVGFTFFSNNKGFIDKNNDDEPLYKSVNTSIDIIDFVHDPTIADDGNDNITNKIFYTIPAGDMPAISTSDAVPGGDTWLRVDRIPPAVYEVTVTGVDGTEGQISNKGGFITFQTDNLASRYSITIMPPEDDPTAFEPLVLTGPAQEGENIVAWDGTDGNGEELPEGELTAIIGVALQTAEVHFPYIDMEINPQGIIIELLNENLNGIESDVVYWDDSDIDNAFNGAPEKPVPVHASHPTIPDGTSSTSNGHRWGTYGETTGSSGNDDSGNYGFGNNKSIDTWTFVDGEAQTFTADIVVKIADLEVETLTSDYCGIVSVGDSWTYTAEIINNGPSDVVTNTDPEEGPLSEGTLFQLYVPNGVDINPASVLMTSLCAEIIGTPTFADGVYSARVDMPFECEATFTIPASAIGGIQTADGNAHAWATLLRPYDFTDPDATNAEPETPPTDPFFEAEGVGVNANDDLFLNPASFDLSETNNIKTDDCVEMYADLDVVKTVTPSSGHDIDDEVTFTITASNSGESDATNVSVLDLLPSRFSYVSHNASQGTYNQFNGLWNIGALNDSGSAVLTINATINATGGSQINTASVSADEYDPDPGNNEDTAQTDAAINTTIEILKTGNRTGTGFGNTATFTLAVSNIGNNTADNVVVIDNLSTRYNNSTPDFEISHGSANFTGTQNRNIEWTIGNLPAGGVAYMVFNVSINGGGTYENEAEAVGDNTNTATDIFTPTTTGAQRDLEIEKLVDNATPDVGETVEFTLNLQRLSGGTVSGVQVTDILPAGFVLTGSPTASQGTYNTTTGVWNVGTIDSGATRTLTVDAIVQPPTGEIDEYRNITAITAAGDVDEDPTNNISDVEIEPLLADLEISKTAIEDAVKVGYQAEYVITLNNNGPNTAENIVVNELLPEGCEWVEDTASQGSYNTGTGIWTVGNLANEASATLTIIVTILNTGDLLNEAEVESDTYDEFLWNNTDSILITRLNNYLITNPMVRSRVISE